MISLEFLNENGLRKYPFADNAPLAPTNGITIPTSLFVDAGLYPAVQNVRIRLKLIEKTVNNIRLYFQGVTAAVTINYPVVVFSIPAVQPLFRNTFSVSGLSGYITFGTGLNSLPNNNYILSDDDYIVDSRVIPQSPKVTDVVFQNFNLGGTVSTVGATSAPTIAEGSNTTIKDVNSSAQLSVSPRTGTGLYDACASVPGIKSINGVSTSNGHFLFASDACQRLVPADHGLFIENLCLAGCSAEAINAAAYYINRVNDGISQIGEAVKGFRDSLNEEIENYLTNTIPARETPFVTPTIAKFGSKNASTGTKTYYTYFTMRMYVYNPSGSTINVTAAATVGSTATLVDIAYLDKDGNKLTTKTPSTTPGFCASSTTPCVSFDVPCKDYVVIKLTARIQNPAFGATSSTLKIDTTIGSKTYKVRSGA